MTEVTMACDEGVRRKQLLEETLREAYPGFRNMSITEEWRYKLDTMSVGLRIDFDWPYEESGRKPPRLMQEQAAKGRF